MSYLCHHSRSLSPVARIFELNKHKDDDYVWLCLWRMVLSHCFFHAYRVATWLQNWASHDIPWIPGATGIVFHLNITIIICSWHLQHHIYTDFYLYNSIHTDIFYHYSAYMIMSFARSRQASALQTRPPWRTMAPPTAPPTAPAAASGGPRPRRQCGGRRRRGRRGPWRSSPCSTGTNKQGSLAHCIVALVKY